MIDMAIVRRGSAWLYALLWTLTSSHLRRLIVKLSFMKKIEDLERVGWLLLAEALERHEFQELEQFVIVIPNSIDLDQAEATIRYRLSTSNVSRVMWIVVEADFVWQYR
jgi:hypothetical protein